MGLSSKKTKTTSKETVGPSTFAQPYVQQALDQTKPALDATQAIVGKYQPLLDKTRGYFDSVIGGDYLKQGNPYLNDVIDNSNQDITDSAASMFSGAGRYGSAYHQGTLGREIGRNSSNLRYQDYANERGIQDSAAGRLPAIAASDAALAALPANIQADLIAQLTGRYLTSDGTSTTKQSGGLLDSIAKIAQIAGTVAAASDRRLKVDITQTGTLEDGLPTYTYRYVTDAPDAPLRSGVMADEVEKLRPWALGPERGGFKTVVYGAL